MVEVTTGVDPGLANRLAERCRSLLSVYLERDTFYFTVCPTAKLVHVGIASGLRCGLCQHFHAWLPVSRAEVKAMADRQLPERVVTFYRKQLALDSPDE